VALIGKRLGSFELCIKFENMHKIWKRSSWHFKYCEFVILWDIRTILCRFIRWLVENQWCKTSHKIVCCCQDIAYLPQGYFNLWHPAERDVVKPFSVCPPVWSVRRMQLLCRNSCTYRPIFALYDSGKANPVAFFEPNHSYKIPMATPLWGRVILFYYLKNRDYGDVGAEAQQGSLAM